jgi:hypothetical protein
MNTTPDPKKDKLDHLLDETLRNIPEREAPESLLANVMARVAEEAETQHLSWFARLQWPVVAVSACFVFFATYFSDEAVTALLGYLNTEQYAGEIQNVNIFLQLVETLFNAMAKVFSLIPSLILYSTIALILTVSAFSCAGIGTVLFRLTRSGNPMSHNQNSLL